jgi:hypothetical protein
MDQETRDFIIHELESINRLVDQKFDTHSKEHALMNSSMNEFKDNLNGRLHTMNEFRAQIEKNQATYLSKDSYDREHNNLMERVNKIDTNLERLSASIVVKDATHDTDQSKTILLAGLALSFLFNFVMIALTFYIAIRGK